MALLVPPWARRAPDALRTGRSQPADARLEGLLDEPIGTIAPEIYGHFTEHLGGVIYDGVWVGEQSTVPNVGGIRRSLVEALRAIKPGVIRWPGGCFADYYHGRDGIGPRDQRPKMVNTVWGGVMEDNSFGTDEYMELIQRLGAEPSSSGTSAAARGKRWRRGGSNWTRPPAVRWATSAGRTANPSPFTSVSGAWATRAGAAAAP